MITRTPIENSSFPCAAMDHFMASQPRFSPAYEALNVALFSIILIGYFLSAFLVWFYQEKSRFAKIRPVVMSWYALFFICLHVSQGTISTGLYWPCMYNVTAQCLGTCLAGFSYLSRLLLLTLENQYAVVVNSRVGRSKSDEEIESQQVLSRSKCSHYRHQLNGIQVLFQLLFFIRNVTDLTLQEIVDAKTHYIAFYLLCNIPCVALIVGLAIGVPSLQCASCTGVFAEMEIAYVALLSYGLIILMLSVIVCYRATKHDNKGVMVEGFCQAMFCGSFAVATCTLVIVDPEDLYAKRIYNWQTNVFVIGVMFWCFAFGYQFYVQYRLDQRAKLERRLRDSKPMHSIKSMTDILGSDLQLKQEFEAFAMKQYVIELVLFLDDIRTFKAFYYQKPESWRKCKVKWLVKNYIEVDSTMQINISSLLRERIIKQAKDTQTTHVDMFDQAQNEIARILEDGAWKDFMREQVRSGKLVPSGS